MTRERIDAVYMWVVSGTEYDRLYEESFLVGSKVFDDESKANEFLETKLGNDDQWDVQKVLVPVDAVDQFIKENTYDDEEEEDDDN